MLSKVKYTSILILPVLTFISFTSYGLWTFAPLIFFFILVPLSELLLNSDPRNLSKIEREFARSDKFYDALIYMLVPIQVGFLIFFLVVCQNAQLVAWELMGRILSMGMMCGLIGINVGHELRHRYGTIDKLLGDILLLTSLENHFAIYHNHGHHLNVATPTDPATAKKGETVYYFWFKSQIMGYIQAWKLEANLLKIKKRRIISLQNRMIQLTGTQIGLLTALFFIFGFNALLFFLAAASFGIILLETVNYIEHYGLERALLANGTYERVGPGHSWNSDHIIGRTLLFELSRHSDHHYKSGKKYQLLDSYKNSPQMPTGYPGMMLLSLVPPLWFLVMHSIKR